MTIIPNDKNKGNLFDNNKEPLETKPNRRHCFYKIKNKLRVLLQAPFKAIRKSKLKMKANMKIKMEPMNEAIYENKSNKTIKLN